MKLIQPSFEIIDQTDFSIEGCKKFIERCARVSYKSENKITEDSYKKFVQMLADRRHLRPFEFATVHLKLDYESFDYMQKTLMVNKALNNIWIKWNHDSKRLEEGPFYVSMNMRYYIFELHNLAPSFDNFIDTENIDKYPVRHTVHFIISRGIMDEFRTHVGLSHIAESSRYCDYSKDKFNNELTFIIPNWVNTHCPNKLQEGPGANDVAWSNSLEEAEYNYFLLLKQGWKPQQARGVLPLDIKSELISCGFDDTWLNFCLQRSSSGAHPMAKAIAGPLYQKLFPIE